MSLRDEINKSFSNYYNHGIKPTLRAYHEEPKLCMHRGKKTGSCSCGATKYICNLIGIEIRTKSRTGHNDINCKNCKKFEPINN